MNTVGGKVEPALGVEGATAAELQEMFDRVEELGAEGLVVSRRGEGRGCLAPARKDWC